MSWFQGSHRVVPRFQNKSTLVTHQRCKLTDNYKYPAIHSLSTEYTSTILKMVKYIMREEN